MDFFLCFCSYLLYITQLINNQEMKPHQYSVYIKSVTMHPVPAFNKARYGSFEFSLGIYLYIPGFDFSWKYQCIPRFEFSLGIYWYIPLIEFSLRIYRYFPPFEFSWEYRKIPKISPGAYIFQRLFLRGLFMEGICVSKSMGLAL